MEIALKAFLFYFYKELSNECGSFQSNGFYTKSVEEFIEGNGCQTVDPDIACELFRALKNKENFSSKVNNVCGHLKQ